MLLQIISDYFVALRFFSRLPLPSLPCEQNPHGPPNFEKVAIYVPLVGLTLGSFLGGILWLATVIGLSSLLGAVITVGVGLVLTGCFHEDGLADTADGFGGGATPTRRLEIMKDSRIGTYGGSALLITLLLRIVAISELVDLSVIYGILGVITSATVSRTAALWLTIGLPPARKEGAAFAAGTPPVRLILLATLLALTVTIIALGPNSPNLWLGYSLVLLVVLWMRNQAKRLIGGQTGDVAGAVQQLTEIAWLIALLWR